MRYNTLSISKKNIKRDWILIDAESQFLGRLASRIAYRLRGKHKTCFTPHVDCGDKIVVVNASKIKLSGNKMRDKKYVSHTGYPGGQKETTPVEILQKHPIRLIEKSVKGMLPKNRLGRQMFRNLYVCKDEKHPYDSQKLKKITLI